MNYQLKTGETASSVEISNIGDGFFTLSRADGPVDVRYTRVSDNQISIVLDGRVRNVFILPGNDSAEVVIDGVVYNVSDAGKDTGSRKKTTRNVPLDITPPMPSVVVRVLVEEGSVVVKGQGVVVVSAMKMETTLKAPYNGRVARIKVAAGDKVMPGDILVDIEKDETQEEAE